MPARFLVGGVRKVLATLPDASVDLVLSSPPFLALRSYLPTDHPDKALEMGSEATPADYLDTLLDVVEDCARVLAPHGSLCFELGDTYAGSGGAGGDYGPQGIRAGQPKFHGPRRRILASWPMDKSLCGIPTLFSWSLAYGRNLLRPDRTTEPWRIRNLVVWARPNPPVGALADKFRPATSYLTVATKARDRYFDLEAVRTEAKVDSNPAGAPPLDYWEISTQPYEGSHYATWPEKLCERPIEAMCPAFVCLDCGTPLGLDRGSSSRVPTPTRDRLPGMRQPDNKSMGAQNDAVLFEDLRQSLYGTQPSDDQRRHSQRQGVPDGLATGSPHGREGRLCNGASASDGPETTADASSVRHSCTPPQRGEDRQSAGKSSPSIEIGARQDSEGSEAAGRVSVVRARRANDGGGPRCGRCGSENLRRGVTLDPFAGTGTTLAVATGHGRDAIGIDLDRRNAQLALKRVGMFLSVE